MFKASRQGNHPMIIAGLSEDNIRRLKNDQPIKVPLRSFGVSLPGDLTIVYGETELEIGRRMKEQGLINEDSQGLTDPKLLQELTIREKHEQILILTCGLPRSGKSTWARSQAYPIVNPDSVRLAIHGQRFIKDAEGFVWATVRAMVKALFLAGHKIVILDAVNNTRKRRDEWKSSEWGLYVKAIDTPKEVCLERARESMDVEIEAVIERMSTEREALQDDEARWPE